MSNNSDIKTAPVFIIVDGEMMIDAPVGDVWPHLIKYTSWQVYSIAEHISGNRDGEGEVVLLKKEEGAPAPPYFARTLRIQPEHSIMWKVYPQTLTRQNDYYGIVDFRLYPQGGRTKFWYSTFYEHQIPYHDESELAAFRTQRTEGLRTVLQIILPKLKHLAEGS